MQQLKVATTALCTEQGPTLSLICPLLCKLKKSFDPIENDSTLIKGLKNMYVEDMDQLRIATALDPRFKDLHFLSVEQKAEVFRRIPVMICQSEQEDDVPALSLTDQPPTGLGAIPSTSQSSPSRSSGAAQSQSVSPEHPPPSKKSALAELLGDIYKDNTEINPYKSLGDVVTKELNSYQNEKCPELAGNSLVWWNEHKLIYPNVARLAKRWFGIPATSVPSE